jgi:HAMP domain-containing protein
MGWAQVRASLGRAAVMRVCVAIGLMVLYFVLFLAGIWVGASLDVRGK